MQEATTIAAQVLAALTPEAQRTVSPENVAAVLAAVAAAGIFTHTARPPLVPAAYPDQRYFGGEHWMADCLCVYRNSKGMAAEVTLRTPFQGVANASIAAIFTPALLREAACRLLDAAHDIEQMPAPRED